MKFSIIHATMGRPEKAVAARQMWFDRASHPESIEYIFGVHADDPTSIQLEALESLDGALSARTIWSETPRSGSAGNYHDAAMLATGDVLIQAQDDLEPPQDWDWHLGHLLACAAPAFVAVSDGHRGDRLCITSIMNRAYFELKGEFMSPEYVGVYGDDENTYRAYRDARDGKCAVIEARHLVFLHRHPGFYPDQVKEDDTYRKENASEAYNHGHRVFYERNPEARKDGIKTW